MEFLSAPDTYYETLRANLKTAKIKVKEDLNHLQVRKDIISASEIIFVLFAACVLKHKLPVSSLRNWKS